LKQLTEPCNLKPRVATFDDPICELKNNFIAGDPKENSRTL
jgi:hypothetical protein